MAPGDTHPDDTDPGPLLRSAAARLEAVAGRATPGDWRIGGLLASRPEVIAHRGDGSTEHVAEARARTAGWISALSPAVAGPLAALLRALADRPDGAAGNEGADLARLLVERLPGADSRGSGAPDS